MKNTTLVLIFLILINSVSKADSVRDFEIEGISISDSLLNFFSEKEIKKFVNYDQLPSDMTFRISEFYDDNNFDMKNYDFIQIYNKPEDREYIIYGIAAGMECKNFECNDKFKTLVNDMENFFSDSKKGTNEEFSHPDDKSGESKIKVWWLELSDGFISVTMKTWSKKLQKDYFDSVSIELSLNEVDEWINNNWGCGENFKNCPG